MGWMCQKRSELSLSPTASSPVQRSGTASDHQRPLPPRVKQPPPNPDSSHTRCVDTHAAHPITHAVASVTSVTPTDLPDKTSRLDVRATRASQAREFSTSAMSAAELFAEASAARAANDLHAAASGYAAAIRLRPDMA